MSTNGWRESSGQAAYRTQHHLVFLDYGRPQDGSWFSWACVLVYCSSSGRKWLVGWPQGRWSHAQKPKYEVGGLPAFQPTTPRRKGKNGGGRGPDGARSRSGSDCPAVTSGVVILYVCTVQVQTQFGLRRTSFQGPSRDERVTDLPSCTLHISAEYTVLYLQHVVS